MAIPVLNGPNPSGVRNDLETNALEAVVEPLIDFPTLLPFESLRLRTPVGDVPYLLTIEAESPLAGEFRVANRARGTVVNFIFDMDGAKYDAELIASVGDPLAFFYVADEGISVAVEVLAPEDNLYLSPPF